MDPSKIRTVVLPSGYSISDDRARLDMDFIHDAMASSYWAIDRPRAMTERSWANSLCIGVYGPDEVQVGCARVLTDYALRAHIADVFIRAQLRGTGLGKALCEFMLSHPELQSVSRWTLTTADAQELYARYGFERGKADDTWMTLAR